MRLSDIMGNLDLAVYPVLALVLFLGVFVLVIGRAFRTDRSQHDRWAQIPLLEGEVTRENPASELKEASR